MPREMTRLEIRDRVACPECGAGVGEVCLRGAHKPDNAPRDRYRPGRKANHKARVDAGHEWLRRLRQRQGAVAWNRMSLEEKSKTISDALANAELR